MGAGEHAHLVRHHEGAVKAHAELADDVDVGLLLRVAHVVFELEGTAAGDDAQVVLHLLFGHADAVVGHGDGARGGVGLDADAEIAAAHAHALVREGEVAQLVDGVRCVGDDLPQEDLLVRIDGIDHQIQQALALRLKLFLCHDMNCLQNCTCIF